MRNKINITRESIKHAIDNSLTMADASRILNCSYQTFKRRAKEYGLFFPNQGSKGISRDRKTTIKTSDILAGKHPDFQTYKLKIRLYKEGLKTNECEICGIYEWNGKPIQCELDHIDGNNGNHVLSNLRILCPNCHSQTDTFRFKRGKMN